MLSQSQYFYIIWEFFTIMKKQALMIGFTLILPFSQIYPILARSEPSILNEPEWAMKRHDAQNTCLSQFDAGGNPGDEKWKFEISNPLYIYTPIINRDGIIFLTSDGSGLYAIDSSGSLKWHQDLEGFKENQPTLGPDGTIYVATMQKLSSFYPNGTLRWRLDSDKDFCGTLTIAPNGTIYAGTLEGYIYALNPDGVIQWTYFIGNSILSLSLDETGHIYTAPYLSPYLYRFNPDGSLSWMIKLPSDSLDSPLIGPDGTLFLSAWSNLLAINQNGTIKWQVNTQYWGESPVLAPDGGIIYSPATNGKIINLDPDTGRINWQYDTGYQICYLKSRPVVSRDGIIFFTFTDCDGHKAFLTALNPNGTLRWNSRLTCNIDPFDHCEVLSNPSISSDGTVYVTSYFNGGYQEKPLCGYIHAFGICSTDAPETPTITGPTQGLTKIPYRYTIQSKSPLGHRVYYFIDWGDDKLSKNEKWIGPFSSNQTITIFHVWKESVYHDLRVFAKDTTGLQGPRSAPRITTIFAPTLIIGAINNLTKTENNLYTFKASKVVYLQSFPPRFDLCKEQEQFIISRSFHVGFLGQNMVFGRFYVVTPPPKNSVPFFYLS
jgi:outer membrane protein assembly factor BamB